MKCKKCTISLIIFLLVAAAAVFFVVRQARAEALSVVINEVAWMGTQDNWRHQWIELYNAGENPVNVENWRLVVPTTEGFDATFKNSDSTSIKNSIINPGEFYLLVRGDESIPSGPHKGTAADLVYGNFGHKWNLNNAGEKLVLKDHTGKTIDEVDGSSNWMDAGDNDTDPKQTMERIDPTTDSNDPANWANGPEGGTPKAQNSVFSSGTETQNATPETDSDTETITNETEVETEVDTNEEQTQEEEQQQEEKTSTQESSTGTQNNSSGDSDKENSGSPTPVSYTENVRINEFMPNPEGKDSENEWIELYNKGNETYDISGWQIDDEEEGSLPFTIDENTTVAAGQYLVFSIQTTGIQLNNSGDEARLIFPNGNEAHTVAYEDSSEGESIAFVGGEWISTDRPTPGSANIGPTPQKTESDKNTNKSAKVSEKTATKQERAPVEESSTEELEASLSSSTPSRAMPFIVAAVVALVGGGGFVLFKKKFLS